MDVYARILPRLFTTLSVVVLLQTVNAVPTPTGSVSLCTEKENPLYRENLRGPVVYSKDIGLEGVTKIPEYKWLLLPERYVTCAANYDEKRSHLVMDFIAESGHYELRPACKKYLADKFIPELKDVVLHDLVLSIKLALSDYLNGYDNLRKELFGEKAIVDTDSSDEEFLTQIDNLRFRLSRHLIASGDAPTPDYDLFRKLTDKPISIYLAVKDSISPPVLSAGHKGDCPPEKSEKDDVGAQKTCASQYLAQLRQNATANVVSGEGNVEPQKVDVLTNWVPLERGIKFLMRNAGKSEDEVKGFELKIPMRKPCYPRLDEGEEKQDEEPQEQDNGGLKPTLSFWGWSW